MCLRSKINFGVCVVFVSLASLTGCATRVSYGTQRMSDFRPDCRIAEQQIAWLQSMRPTESEKATAKVRSVFLKAPMLNDSYWDNRLVSEGYIDWWVETNIRQVYMLSLIHI